MEVWAAAVAIGLFAAAYVLFAWKEAQKALTAAAFAAGGLLVAVASGGLPLDGAGLCQLFSYQPHGSPWGTYQCATAGYVEWDTLGLLVGLFLLAALLDRLEVFRYVAIRMARWSQGRPVALFLSLSLLAFGLSAFINSITVMVILAAITVDLSRSLKISPVPLILAEISCSNAGGAATFVGDPPNVILGTYFGLGFDDFLVHAAPLALGALAVTLGLFWWVARRDARRERSKEAPSATGPVTVFPPTPTLDLPRVSLAVGAFGVTIGLLAINALIPPSVGEIGLIGGALALLVAGREGAMKLVQKVDWVTLSFFFFLFLLVGALEATGAIGDIASAVGAAGGSNALLTASLLLWTLGLLSSVIDNVPLAAAAGPLIASLQATRHVPVGSMVYASAVGTDVGGNGTPIGASGNVVGLAVAKSRGVEISWRTYVARAFPIMVAALLVANIVLVLLS